MILALKLIVSTWNWDANSHPLRSPLTDGDIWISNKPLENVDNIVKDRLYVWHWSDPTNGQIIIAKTWKVFPDTLV